MVIKEQLILYNLNKHLEYVTFNNKLDSFKVFMLDNRKENLLLD